PEVNTGQPVGRGGASRQDLGTIGAPPVENYATLQPGGTRIDAPPKSAARPEPPPMPKKAAPPPFTFEPEPAPAPAKPKPVVLRSEPSSPPAEEPTEEINSAGAMVGGFLFFLVLLAGLALFGYVFVWPFFQAPTGG